MSLFEKQIGSSRLPRRLLALLGLIAVVVATGSPVLVQTPSGAPSDLEVSTGGASGGTSVSQGLYDEREVEEAVRGPQGSGYRPQGWLSLVLLVDGRMENVWRQERKGERLAVRIEPFGNQPEWVRRAAEGEAERLSRFLGGELDLAWSNP
jgi:hypothetical protein